MATDLRTTALTALASIPADPANLLLYVADLTEALPANQSKKMALTLLDARYLEAADIGTTIQAWDADLDTIAGLAKTDGNFIVGDGAAWVVESGATARTSLGLGTIATQNASGVTISGGSITGITDLAIADGGTGQSTAQAAIDALSNVAVATNEHVLTKDTATGNAIFKAAAGGSSLPVADTQTIIKGSADATKLLRFEVDGFTAGATRVLTPPNQDTLLAGQNFANIFTAAQTISGATASVIPLTVKSTDNSVTNPVARWLSSGDLTILGIDIKTAGGNPTSEIWMTNLAAATKTHVWDFLNSDTPRQYILSPHASGKFFGAACGSGGAVFAYDSAGYYGLEAVSAITGIGQSLQNYKFMNWVNGQTIISDNAYTSNGSSTTAPSANQLFVHGRANRTAGKFITEHSTTDAVTNALKVGYRSTGTPTTGLGVGLNFILHSSTTVDQDVGRLTYEWATATHASRKALAKWTVFDTAEREGIRIEASGTAAMLGVLGAAAIARQAHIVDADGTLADITTKFNSLLAYLENFGFIATS